MAGVGRRRVLGTAVGVAGLAVVGLGRRAGGQGMAPIAQPAAPGPAAWTARALAMRQQAEQQGDQPYGAVVVRAGRIVGEAPSRAVTGRDPTAHAEMEAIRDACRRLGSSSLAGAELYASSRPCRMCETAAYWAGVARMVHGAGGDDAGAPRYGGC
jgi:tRNA(Arg) A34 adenosine deaminase TadA